MGARRVAATRSPPSNQLCFHFVLSADMDNLKAWGFTAVRLFVAWPGVNPSKGQVSLAFFSVFVASSSRDLDLNVK